MSEIFKLFKRTEQASSESAPAFDSDVITPDGSNGSSSEFHTLPKIVETPPGKQEIFQEKTEIPISIDTQKAEVARRAVESGVVPEEALKQVGPGA